MSEAKKQRKMEAQEKLVWLDCDPGHDDMMAIFLATHTPGLKLIGLSTSHGNVDVEKTTANTLKACLMAGCTDVPIYKGQAKPIVRDAWVCPEIHGDSGLDGTSFDWSILESAEFSNQVKPQKAVMAMAEAIRGEGENAKSKVTVVATGCQTNVALMLTLFPEVKSNIEEIVFMGGGIGFGNITPAAEFNILIDPEAARIVMESGCRVVMVPLEVTHKCLVTKEVLASINEIGSNFSTIVNDLLLFFKKTYDEVFGMPDPPLHDPCAIAYVINKELFKTATCNVFIDTSESPTAGRTCCDMFKLNKDAKHTAIVCESMDVESFWTLMISSLKRADAVSGVN